MFHVKSKRVKKAFPFLDVYIDFVKSKKKITFTLVTSPVPWLILAISIDKHKQNSYNKTTIKRLKNIKITQNLTGLWSN